MGVLKQPPCVVRRHADAAMTVGNSKGLNGVLLPWSRVKVDGFVGGHSLRVGHSRDREGRLLHGGCSILSEQLLCPMGVGVEAFPY